MMLPAYVIGIASKMRLFTSHMPLTWTIKPSPFKPCRPFSSQSHDLDKTAYRLLYVILEESDKKKLSALYMQATEGKCHEPRPGPRDNPSELEYWNDWNDLGDMSKDEAVQQYLAIAKKYV